MKWHGVMPAITTPFAEDLSIDHGFLAQHAATLVDAGCTGIIGAGSLGEGATLSTAEKGALLATLVGAVGARVPVVAGVAALSTREAVEQAKGAERAGCKGLMVLPPYVYSTDWKEMRAHIDAVVSATPLSCMLYNNPIAYKTDFLPEQIVELAAAHKNLHAVKESSADIRRIAGIRALLGERLAILVGVDDLIVEGVLAGAVGWVAGLVSAFPRESVELFNLAMKGDMARATPLYHWFLPLLRLDTVPKLVQLIKLAQAEVGLGNARVRPPRLELEGAELGAAMRIIRGAIAARPVLG